MTYEAIGNNDAIGLDGFKRYARIVGDTYDNELRSILQDATIRVQEYADRALLPCTITIEGEGTSIQLWQPIVSGIVSVVDIDSGEDVVSDCLASSHTIYLPRAGRWRVTYTTQPLTYDVYRLRGYVWEMAAAMWDGNTEEETKVYQRIPADYVVR